jgi:hypothetical protein
MSSRRCIATGRRVAQVHVAPERFPYNRPMGGEGGGE